MMVLSTRFLLCVSAVVWVLTSPVVEAAHSRRRPSSAPARKADVHYDRSITTFSKDGRLLQVEYSMRASHRGGPVAAFKTRDGKSILLAVSSSAGGAVSSNDKVHRIDEHILMAIAGLSGDGRFIARHLRVFCQQQRLTNGEAPTVEEVAQEAANMQHFMTRSPGSRPLGCTTIIWGADAASSGKLGRQRLFRTDPGGVLVECLFAAAGQNEAEVLEELDKMVRSTPREDHATENLSLWTEFVATVLKKTTPDHGEELNEEDLSKEGIGGVDFWLTTRTTNDEFHVRKVEGITRRSLKERLSLLV